jgi:hypothetical protein
MLYGRPPAATPPAPAQARQVEAPQPVLRAEPPPAAILQEVNPEFVEPRPWALWMSEARNPEELAARLAAKDARAVRMREIKENPRYIGSTNGFRFQCKDCGGIFEDDNEGIHANAKCLVRGGRPSGWRC